VALKKVQIEAIKGPIPKASQKRFRVRRGSGMRDSDLAIGGLVLLGIVGVFLYFLFPNLITGLLRGPSYGSIIQAEQNEIAAFNRETEIIVSYLQDSWTMKIYRRIDSIIGKHSYEDWIQKMKAQREDLVRDSLRTIDIDRPTADGLAQSLESKKSLRDKTKGSIFKLGKSPLDSEIDALQAELDKKSNRFSEVLRRFSEGRRSLIQKALIEWFKRSLLVGLFLATIVILFLSAILLTRSASNTKLTPESKQREIKHFSFASKKPRQSGLIKGGESPVLSGSAFHFNFDLQTGPIPEPIRDAIKELSETKTALKLASILGGYPETPASRSHHSCETGGLIAHTAKVLVHSEPLLPLLPDPRTGTVVILAHDIGKLLTLNNQEEGRPHDIPSADIVASLPELREEFDEITARSMILAIGHQHSKAEIPLNAPPLTETIFQFIKKADLSASAEESREAAVKMRTLLPKVIEFFPYIIPELNVNGCMGGKAEGYLSDGYLFLFKEPVKEKLLRYVDTQGAPVFKGQDLVWNEMAAGLAEAGLITTRARAKEAGKKSCLFTIKTPQGQEKAIAIPIPNVAHHLLEQWLQTNSPKIEVL